MAIRLGPVHFTGPGNRGLGEFAVGSLPVAGHVSDTFGSTTYSTKPHRGLDVEAPLGAPVHAPAPGLVLRVGYLPATAGHFLVLRHGEGVQSHYYHLRDAPLVTVGQTVARGDALGHVGQTGHASGPHLHWAVYLTDVGYVDPLVYIVLPGELDSMPIAAAGPDSLAEAPGGVLATPRGAAPVGVDDGS